MLSRFIFCVVLLGVMSGCRVFGDRSSLMLSPEELALVQEHRKNNPPEITRSRAVLTEFGENFGLLSSHADEAPWDFRWSWDRGVSTPGAPSEDNPEYDADGNLIVAPEIARTYSIPDMHAGIMYDFTEDKVRSLLEVELFEFKAPRLRWWSVGVDAAEGYLGAHISKRWTSIFEVETGLFVGRDFETDTTTWGLGGLIIKF